MGQIPKELATNIAYRCAHCDRYLQEWEIVRVEVRPGSDGARPLLNLPFHYAIDDAMYFSFAWLGSDNSAQRMMDPDHVEEIWWQAFLQQYRQGGYLNICMHPFVSGRALRIAMLDRLIARMKALPGVWFPTCEQVARHILATHPAH